MKLRLGIQTKLVSLLLFLSLLPLSFVMLLAYRQGQSVLQHTIGLKFEEMASETIGKIDRLLFFAKEDLKVWAHVQLQGPATGDPGQSMTDMLVGFKRDYGVYSGIFYTSPQGEIIASSDSRRLGQRVSEAPWFLDAVKMAQMDIRDLAYDELVGGFAVTMTVPVHAAHDPTVILGYLSSRFNWSELFEITNGIRVNPAGQSESGYAVLINREGVVISGPGFLLAKEEEEGQTLSHMDFLALGYQSAQRALQGQRGFLVETDPKTGKSWLIGYAGSRGYRDFRGLGWAILILQDTVQAFAPARHLRNQSISFSTIVALFTLLCAVFVAKGVTHPVRKLTTAAEAIARGDFSQRVVVRSHDELETLAGAFSTMAEDLGRALEQEKSLAVATATAETERRRAQELARLNAELTKEITRRQQAEAKLRDYASQLERSNKELDDFTYIVSHDLKEPLRSIDAFSRFLEDELRDQLTGETQGYLERVRANARRMQALIEDLLELSRLSKRANQLQLVKPGELLDEIRARFEARIQERHVQIVVNDELPTVLCDRVRLGEVFANLISNAVKYNDKPQPRIEIGYRATDGYHEFFVKDNGPGIEPKYFEKIFEIFQRLGKKEEQEGTGVGLTIVKKIVELHHGRVWLESTVGQGTTFYFTVLKDEQVLLGKKKLGEILIEKGVVSQQAVDEALDAQQRGKDMVAREEIAREEERDG